jgi:hypothetical protein
LEGVARSSNSSSLNVTLPNKEKIAAPPSMKLTAKRSAAAADGECARDVCEIHICLMDRHLFYFTTQSQAERSK